MSLFLITIHLHRNELVAGDYSKHSLVSVVQLPFNVNTMLTAIKTPAKAKIIITLEPSRVGGISIRHPYY